MSRRPRALQRAGSRAVLVLSLLAGCLASGASRAGEIIAFEPGKPPPPAVLKDLPMKGVIAEFLDPDDTGLGKELSNLLWRELLDAISDQAGAGVILARTPGDQRITELLGSAYHGAALKIAAAQGARMALWGALEAQEGRISVEVFLSLLGDAPGWELALRLRANEADTGLLARIARTKFNFAPVALERAALFPRTVVTRANTALQKPPGLAANPAYGPAPLPAGTALRTESLRGR